MTKLQLKNEQPIQDKNEINPNLKPIDKNANVITFGWMRPVIKKIRKQKTMNKCDIHPLSVEMGAFSAGRKSAQSWNIALKSSRQQNKPMKSLLKQLFVSNKSRLMWLIFLVPITSLCGVCALIALRSFTGFLKPQSFYDCDQLLVQTPPSFVNLPYKDGLTKALKELWGYLILVISSQLLNIVIQNISFSLVLKSTVQGVNGFLDLIYQKILVMSDQARTGTAQGNVTNLLYSDTQKISQLLIYLHQLCQVPLDLIIYIIYLGVQIDPLGLTGLTAYMVLFPMLGIVMGKVSFLQNKNMSLRDLRVKRSTEVLNGIKVIKLFSQEKVQHARLQNARDKEISTLLLFCVCMSFFGLVQTAASPMMTSIAFAALNFSNKFDVAGAFTTMFLFQYLANSIVLLPIMMSSLSEAKISSRRIATFLQLSEQDPGVIIQMKDLSAEQQNKVSEYTETMAIKVLNKPSFTWQLASDKYVPDILDPFYKENTKAINRINKTFPQTLEKFKQNLSTFTTPLKLQPAKVEIQIAKQQEDLEQDIEEIRNAAEHTPKNMDVIDKWCLELDLPYVSRLCSLEQYNYVNYLPQKKDSQFTVLKKQAVNIQSMRYFMNKAANNETYDNPDVVKNLDIEIQRGELIGICGQVGSGKTSLFSAILGEMRVSGKQRENMFKYTNKEGQQYINFDYNNEDIPVEQDPRFDPKIPHIIINGKLAYFSQQSHIFTRTAKENILFGKEFDPIKYQKVVKICCLEDDFKIMADGDNTEIGGKGVTLSGGQKARVALARAIYSDPDIILLDDPLSAVDAHVGKTIWNDAILGYLRQRGTTVLIASHQTQYFNDCDRVMNIVDGEIKTFMTVAQIIENKIKILGITGEQSTFKSHQLEQSATVQVVPAVEEKNVITTQKKEQQTSQGVVKGQTYKKWFYSGSTTLAVFLIFILVLNQSITQYQNILVSHWSSDKYGWTAKNQSQGHSTDVTIENCVDIPTRWCTNTQASVGELFSISSPVEPSMRAMILSTCVTENNADITMKQGSPSDNYLWLYIGLTGVIIITSFSSNLCLTAFFLTISSKLHNIMLKSLLHTKMSFFDTTPQGQILNRLSKDTDAVDSNVLRWAQVSTSTFLMIAGMIISIAAVNYPALVVIIPCFIVFIVVFLSFRTIFPQIKRLEAVTRSPVFNICQETIDCLVSIRAFGAQKDQTRMYREAVNINSSLYYQQYGIQRWLFFRLGILTSLFAFFVTLAATIVAPLMDSVAQYTGVVISYAFSISNLLNQFVMGLVTLEGEMSSVERLIEYQDLPAEGIFVKPDFKLANDWPRNNSGIEVKNLQFRYRPELDLVLKKLDFKLQPKEHIGIVGRTGAGKSSITVAMYRLAEPDKGSEIIVDGVNILDLGLHQARKAFTIIPQDPFLFSGTLRQCLCPYSQADAEGVKTEGLERIDDKRMWEALEQVQMKEYFLKQPGQLDSKIATNGDNLSAGQKQLVCVARALLRKASCVILDEATAQVDRENDQLIQQTIRNAFSEVTVLSIAHRLDTIIDFDRIIVMDKGNIAEFDTPANLVRKEGVFFELVNKTGAETSEKLKKAAFQAERQRQAGEKVNVDID
ncbi:Xenobiotic-transporting_ATPase / Multidrug resistance-associated protein [Hexamita inflata]|uniref:Xenobiotic-transporting ATPase / Multidrug resistance-associated protein n=1 Tax=Hexamita inflata TaxID=28002 RepID=A0AA86QKE1_9EUKA|nr:Xenobiotic-transporting ATPase / Multidrug resistance-associated protein [Hexamita inflata]